jgi:hypothetical protein
MEPDEKSASVMVYTATGLSWGEVVVKEQIRVSTWLRTNASPDIVCLYNAKTITTTNNAPPKPLQFSELHIMNQQVVAFHLMPPAKDPLDFDPNEPNRRMDPITVMVGTFRIDGLMRIAVKSNLSKYLEVTRENFAAIYDAEITCPVMPSLGVMRVPYVIVRMSSSMFATRTA